MVATGQEIFWQVVITFFSSQNQFIIPLGHDNDVVTFDVSLNLTTKLKGDLFKVSIHLFKHATNSFKSKVMDSIYRSPFKDVATRHRDEQTNT